MYDDVKKNMREQGFVLWFTGFSQAGKTTVADRLNEMLAKKNIKTERLDGDIVRQSLTKDLGFSKEDRDTNIERVAFVAKLLSRNGVGVLVSFISPYRKQREMVRKEVTNFIEVFVNAPLKVCEGRDTRGLYKKARQGKIDNFTGISDPYEEPVNPDVEIKTDKYGVDDCAKQIMDYLVAVGYVNDYVSSVEVG